MMHSGLTGVWIATGGWFTYAVVSRPDGQGRLEFSGVRTTHSLTFGWQYEGGSLEIDGRQQATLNDAQDGVETRPWESVVTIGASIVPVRPAGVPGPSRLRLSQPVLDWFPTEYLSGNPATDVFSPPDFPWLRTGSP